MGKKKTFSRLGWAALPLLLIMVSSCDDFLSGEDKKGSMRIFFSEPYYVQTKAGYEIPDSCDFLLSVVDQNNKVVYKGKYGDSPQEMMVVPGKYSVSVRSSEAKMPAFDSPVYGDDREVLVASGGKTDVVMKCAQVNSGIRLNINSNFLDSYPDGILSVSSAEGKLKYLYREKRIAYFNPGKVTVNLSYSGSEEDLFYRYLDAKEILTVNISAPNGSASASSGQISLAVDTTRSWIMENFTIGASAGDGSGSLDGGSDINSAVNIAAAVNMSGQKDVWVYGYIVGCYASARSQLTYEEPFTKDTNLAIAVRASVTEKESTMAVELTKGDMRNELNLQYNPENHGRKLFVKGDIEDYYGTVGIKNISGYKML